MVTKDLIIALFLCGGRGVCRVMETRLWQIFFLILVKLIGMHKISIIIPFKVQKGLPHLKRNVSSNSRSRFSTFVLDIRTRLVEPVKPETK